MATQSVLVVYDQGSDHVEPSSVRMDAEARYVGLDHRDRDVAMYDVALPGLAGEFRGIASECDCRVPITVTLTRVWLRGLPQDERRAAVRWLREQRLMVREDGKLMPSYRQAR